MYRDVCNIAKWWTLKLFKTNLYIALIQNSSSHQIGLSYTAPY